MLQVYRNPECRGDGSCMYKCMSNSCREERVTANSTKVHFHRMRSAVCRTCLPCDCIDCEQSFMKWELANDRCFSCNYRLRIEIMKNTGS